LALTPGTRFGVYEVTAQIGQGGMGQVYGDRHRSWLPSRRQGSAEAFAQGVERLARFDREAGTLASLNQ
jgi:serine/threonine protein kinase